MDDDVRLQIGFASGTPTPPLTVSKSSYDDLHTWLADPALGGAIELYALTDDGPRAYLLRRDAVEYVVAVEEAP